MQADETARALGDRLEALAVALRDAGVPPERADALLSSASAATMSAVTLVALLRGDMPRNQVAASIAVKAAPALAA